MVASTALATRGSRSITTSNRRGSSTMTVVSLSVVTVADQTVRLDHPPEDLVFIEK